MRKCDICDTVIPFGENRCPNCGHYYKKDRPLSDRVKKEKKDRYMAQFQPHPSPVSQSIQKTDLSKDNVKQVMRRTIKIVVIVSLIVTAIPIMIGVIINQITHTSHSEALPVQLEYGKFYSMNELESASPELAKEAMPYYKHVLDLTETFLGENNYTFSEYYLVENGLLYNIEIVSLFYVASTPISYQLTYTFLNNGSSYINIDCSQKMEGEPIIDEQILQMYANLSGISFDELNLASNDFINAYHQGSTYPTCSIGESSLMFSYYDEQLSYHLLYPIDFN